MALLLTLLIFRRKILNAEQKGLASVAVQFITGSQKASSLCVLPITMLIVMLSPSKTASTKPLVWLNKQTCY
jgi:hypothetical protein